MLCFRLYATLRPVTGWCLLGYSIVRYVVSIVPNAEIMRRRAENIVILQKILQFLTYCVRINFVISCPG